MKIKTLFILFIILLAGIQLHGQVRISAGLDTTNLLIGDQTELYVNVKLEDANTTIKDISFQVIDTVSGVEIVKTSELSLINKKERLWGKGVILTAFEAGHYVLPPAQITVHENGQDKIYRTGSLAFNVSTLEVDEETALQQIKNIEHEFINFRDILPYPLGLLVLILIIFLIKKMKRKERGAIIEKTVPKVIIPPHKIALEKLAELDKKRLWQVGRFKAFQSELTFILREYLEKRYNIPALESTTYEIIKDVRGKEISDAQTQNLQKILETADLVKFAKSEPPIEVHQEAFDEIKAFVLDTKKELTAEMKEENND